MRRHLGITLEPIRDDPLLPPNGRQPWEPRPLDLARHASSPGSSGLRRPMPNGVGDAFTLLTTGARPRRCAYSRSTDGRPRPRGVVSLARSHPAGRRAASSAPRRELGVRTSSLALYGAIDGGSIAPRKLPLWGEISSPSPTSPSYRELSLGKCCCHRFCRCPRPPGHRHQRPPACRQRDEMAEPLRGYSVRAATEH
jgi:hypothetical protein